MIEKKELKEICIGTLIGILLIGACVGAIKFADKMDEATDFSRNIGTIFKGAVVVPRDEPFTFRGKDLLFVDNNVIGNGTKIPVTRFSLSAGEVMSYNLYLFQVDQRWYVMPCCTYRNGRESTVWIIVDSTNYRIGKCRDVKWTVDNYCGLDMCTTLEQYLPELEDL